MSKTVFQYSIYVDINTDDEGNLESVKLVNGQNLPRAAQHQVMIEAHTAWQKSLGDDKLAILEVLPYERGANWSLFKAWVHKRSTEK